MESLLITKLKAFKVTNLELLRCPCELHYARYKFNGRLYCHTCSLIPLNVTNQWGLEQVGRTSQRSMVIPPGQKLIERAIKK